MGLYEVVERDIYEAFRHYAARRAEYLPPAREEFERAVRAAAFRAVAPRRSDVELANLCFTEWFLFESGLGEGKAGLTPLGRFATDPPPRTDSGLVERLGQVVRTQLFSHFSILEKNLAAGRVRVADVRTGTEYLVRNPQACRRRAWRDGTLSQRIACVDGQWLHVGRSLFYDRSPHGPDREVLEGSYLSFLRDVIGIDGRFRGSLRTVPA